MPASRFRDDEVLEITRLSAPLVGAGVWSPLERFTTHTEDRIRIDVPKLGSFYLFFRDKTGWTYLLYCTQTDWKIAASGTMEECLRRFRR